MLTDDFGQAIPYLDYTDIPDLNAWGSALVGAVAQQTVMRFASASSRGATLTGATAPVPGMLCYLVSEDRFEAYTSGQGWIPVTPGPWATLPYGTGYQGFAGNPGYRLINGTVQLRGQVSKTDGTVFTSNGTTGYAIATLPSGFRPTYTVELPAAQELATNYVCRQQIGTDGVITAFIETGGNPHWVGLDGLSFPVT